MTDIYDQHKTAFASVSAFVILGGHGSRVATVALKFPRDGAGRLYAYVHLLGVPMVRAHASGYGCDKCSAAVAAAIGKIPAYAVEPGQVIGAYGQAVNVARSVLQTAAPDMDSRDWTRALENRGFRVLQAV